MGTAETQSLRGTQGNATTGGTTSAASHRDRKSDRRGPWRWLPAEAPVEPVHIDQRVLDLCG